MDVDTPTDEGNFIPVVESHEAPVLMRVYFTFFFSVAVAASYFLWKVTDRVDTEKGLSLRGEVLLNTCVFLGVYCFAWIPILLIGIIDGGLEAASVSSGLKGQIANLHCSLQDVFVRAFCMCFIVSSAIYTRYGGLKMSNHCCCGRPVVFIWATFIPVLLIELSRMAMEQEEWLMPTGSITSYLSSVQFSVRATPALCVQMMDASWIRQILIEWFMSAALVVVVVYCMAPVFLRQKNSESKAKSKSGQSSDSDTEDCSDAPGSRLRQAESLESLAEQPEGELYARGYGFLEAIMAIGVLWATILRPFMAITMYIRHTDTYSNHLDLPTHVLLLIAVFILPAELVLTERERSAKQKEEMKAEEKDDDIIWIIDEEKGTAYTLRSDADVDVDPIWIDSDVNKLNDEQDESTTSEQNVSHVKKTQPSSK